MISEHLQLVERAARMLGQGFIRATYVCAMVAHGPPCPSRHLHFPMRKMASNELLQSDSENS